MSFRLLAVGKCLISEFLLIYSDFFFSGYALLMHHQVILQVRYFFLIIVKFGEINDSSFNQLVPCIYKAEIRSI